MLENRVEAHNSGKKMKTREQDRSEGAAAQVSEEREMELGGGGVAMGGAGQPGGAGRGHEMTGDGGGVDDDEQVGGNTTEPSETIQMGELDQQPVHAASSAPDHRFSGSGRGGKPTAMQRDGQLQSNATWAKDHRESGHLIRSLQREMELGCGCGGGVAMGGAGQPSGCI